MRTSLAAVAVVCAALSCGSPKGKGAVAPESSGDGALEPIIAQASAGVEHADLSTLLRDHWSWRLEREPVWATTRGDRRNDSKLSDGSHAAVMRRLEDHKGFVARAQALSGLSAADEITRSLFVQTLENSIAQAVCENHLWSVSSMSNAVNGLGRLPKRHPIETTEHAETLLLRYGAIAGYIDDRIANLRAGKRKGLVANAETLRRLVAMIDGLLAKPTSEWRLAEPVTSVKKVAAIPEADKTRLSAAFAAALDSTVKPAFTRYRDLVRDELIPSARGADAEGIGALPNGAACYRARIRRHLGMDRSPEELHKLGLKEIEKINGEMVALGNKLFGLTDMASVVEKLRTDKSLYYEDEKAIVDKAKASLAAAERAMPKFFGRTPTIKCEVVPIPEAQAPFSTIAYYQPPEEGSGKPGEYFINTYKPEVRPRFEMEVLAFHEAIPGHHLQLALSHEARALPAFRRFGGSTAFIEGWALYTERLSDEMGLYSGDLDRMGMLSYDAWRAARLVVDTGLHALGWDRARAEKYMLEHTALAPANIRNEVDRYINWPGQALAYKFGQLEMWRLRREAEAALGDKFDIRGFHDAVLANGAVTLPVLAAQIERWVSSQR